MTETSFHLTIGGENHVAEYRSWIYLSFDQRYSQCFGTISICSRFTRPTRIPLSHQCPVYTIKSLERFSALKICSFLPLAITPTYSLEFFARAYFSTRNFKEILKLFFPKIFNKMTLLTLLVCVCGEYSTITSMDHPTNSG